MPLRLFRKLNELVPRDLESVLGVGLSLAPDKPRLRQDHVAEMIAVRRPHLKLDPLVLDFHLNTTLDSNGNFGWIWWLGSLGANRCINVLVCVRNSNLAGEKLGKNGVAKRRERSGLKAIDSDLCHPRPRLLAKQLGNGRRRHSSEKLVKTIRGHSLSTTRARHVLDRMQSQPF